MGRPLLLLGVLLFLGACAQQDPAVQVEAEGEAPEVSAQAAGGGVFFSEYVEGTSNNKALEIYNATGTEIDLEGGGYVIEQYSNGGTTTSLRLDLKGTLTPGEVHVFAHSSAAAEILAVADQISGAGFFNGDDALVLKRGNEVLDVIGQIGIDPGSEWGSGLTSTADNTLRRKPTICVGETDGGDAFDPAVEWDGYPTNTFDGLGSHTSECEGVGDGGDGGDGGDDGNGGEPHDPQQCGAEATFIHQVQGNGAVGPLAGSVVTIEGIVVGDFQRLDADRYETNLGGFMLQEEDADADDDPATSEGIYVFHSANDVAVGDHLRVTGTAGEFNGLTQVSSVTSLVVCDNDVPLPTPAEIEFPLPSVDALEAYEGMLVTFPQDLVIAEYFNFDRFGEIVLTWVPDGMERWQQPTALYEPGSPEIDEYVEQMALSRITLDDGIGDQNPRIVRHPDGGLVTQDHVFRGGDVLRDLTGVLDFAFGQYRVQPVLGAEYVESNPRPAAPDVGGSVRAAAFNVLNYFVTLGSRGADDDNEFNRQRTKIIAALEAMDAHVVGLIEIENRADQHALADLTSGLNDVAGAGTYAYVDTAGPVGTDEIMVGLIYQPAVLQPVGAPAILDTPEFLDPLESGEDRNRAALAQTFEEVATGARFTVVVNHFKSKGSECGESGEGGLVGNCDLTRAAAAEALLEWLATDPTGAGDPDFLLLGDFNAYDHEEPIGVLRAGQDGAAGTNDDYVDLLKEFEGEHAYTYVFDGQLGYLDYAFASSSLFGQVAGATAWHINADEPDVIDYDTSFKSPGQARLYSPDPYRSSDHDPVIVGLDLTVPVSCEVQPSSDSLWPANGKLVPLYLDVDSSISVTIDSIYQDEPVLGSGSGNTSPDAVIHADGTFELRAERAGNGNGRVYHVAFTLSDGFSSCSSVVTVGVPHSQGRNGAPVDDGALYDSTAP